MKTQIVGEIEYLYGVEESNPITVDNYPWGFKLRTEQRYWLEKTKRGTRFVYQTKNPKTGRWCKEKKSTYSMYGVICRATTGEKEGHIKWTAISKYSDTEKWQKFLDLHRDFLEPSEAKEIEVLIGARKRLSKAFDDDTEKAKESLENATEINLDEKLFWTEDEIKKSPINLNLIRVDVHGKGIKKRKRKVDTHYDNLFFIKEQEIDDGIREKAKEEAKKFLDENYREWHGANLIFKDTEFTAPRPDSPTMCGWKTMLMSHRERIAL